MKRFIDFVLSGVALVLLSPLLAAIALLIYALSPGPVLFSQMRVGKDMKPFRLYKFRTMRIASDPSTASTVTLANDPRIFFGGNMIRALKLDELPQLFNILLGSMSLVGPRPTVMSDYEQMTEEQKQRANVLPGLTGLAQISGNTSLTWEQRIEYDLQYIRNMSIWRDIRIIWKTAILVLTNRADSHPQSDSEWS